MGTEGETKANNNATQKKNNDDGKWSDFIWNGKTNQFFGRTGSSWVKIFVFYVVFYAALAAFSWLCYYLFAQISLTEGQPRWILGDSIIGTNPGVGFRPLPDQDQNSGSSLIWFDRSKDADASIWYNQLRNYTDKIENPEGKDSLQVCSYEDGKRATKDKACRVDLKEFGPECAKGNSFGYRKGEPCILIKLNRIFAWKPEAFGVNKQGEYDESLLKKDLDNLKDMPDDLRKHIENDVKKESNKAAFLDTVWISCKGENVGDEENLGPLTYYPRRGIAGYYYPYFKQPGYQSPFIFVQLTKPRFGILINIECRAWAKNIKYDRIDRLGSVHLEILVD